MEAVKDWIDSGCDYASGVRLFEQIGKNKLLMRQFSRNSSISNQKKLEYELRKFLPIEAKQMVEKVQHIAQSINVEAIVEHQVQQYESKQTELIKQLPEELLPVLFRANLLFRESCILKLQLNNMPDEAEAECLKIQLQIDDKFKENRLCWKQIDHYLEHKQLPKIAKSQFDNLTPAELVKRQQYHFQNISKLKKRITENRKVLSTTDSVSVKARLERTLAKQESDLLAKENELQTLTNLVNGKQ
jgi:hypothetical protein